MIDINSTFLKYADTDKPKYADFYQRHFDGLSPNFLLEIGVAGGGSLRAWKDIFPLATVVGIDIDQIIKDNNKDLTICIGDQIDTVFLDGVIKSFGNPDIIIDDGGHSRSQQVRSFVWLWQHLKSGGLYIIEDLETGFVDAYNDYPQSGIDRIISCLKPLEWTGELSGLKIGDPLTYIYSFITFEPNICILRKA